MSDEDGSPFSKGLENVLTKSIKFSKKTTLLTKALSGKGGSCRTTAAQAKNNSTTDSCVAHFLPD